MTSPDRTEQTARWLAEHFYVAAVDHDEEWDDLPEWQRTAYRKHAADLIALLTPSPDGGETFQDRVRPWMLTCFNAQIAGDRLERADRFIEEALELVQSGGYDKERAHALVEYVYGRPQGDINQEVGGVMVTLAAYCLAFGVNMHTEAERELARINQPEIITKIRAKQASKPKGSALPIALQSPPASSRNEGIEEAALLDEASRLLRIAFVALYRLRLIDRGHDLSLSHELREFAHDFSEDDTSGKHGQFKSGNGAYKKWREAVRAITSQPSSPAVSEDAKELAGETSRPDARASEAKADSTSSRTATCASGAVPPYLAASGNVRPSNTPSVSKDVIAKITDPIEKIVAEGLVTSGLHFTSEKSGEHRLDFGVGNGVFIEVKQFYTARADLALQKNENIIIVQGRRAAEWLRKALATAIRNMEE